MFVTLKNRFLRSVSNVGYEMNAYVICSKYMTISTICGAVSTSPFAKDYPR